MQRATLHLHCACATVCQLRSMLFNPIANEKRERKIAPAEKKKQKLITTNCIHAIYITYTFRQACRMHSNHINYSYLSALICMQIYSHFVLVNT